jgi:hypothetical protein
MDGVAAVFLVVSSLGIGVLIARVALNEVLRVARIASSDRPRQ